MRYRVTAAAMIAATAALAASVSAAAAVDAAAREQARELAQWGITWRFDQPARVGRYVNGDWWVVGPVTVTSIDPAPGKEERHGSVVNPPAGDRHGYDVRMPSYDPSLRAELPLTLQPGDSLVSTASVQNVGDKTPDTIRGHYARGPLRTAAVLTCVDTPPPADAFRPAYVGQWKGNFTRSQLRTDLLPALAPVEPPPDTAFLERALQRIWLDHQQQWVNRQMHPLENMPDYGREITHVTGQAALLLLLDGATERYGDLLTRYVQLGIDYFGVVQSDDHLWIGNGGHNSGRKLPIIFAGLMLGHEKMMRVDATFSEDDQTYFGDGYAGQKALFSIAPGNPNNRHEEFPPDQWETYGKGNNNGKKAESYRKLNGPTWVAHGLTVRLLGAAELWDHPPFLAYVDRWMREEGSAPKFVLAMWEAYRDEADMIGDGVRAKWHARGGER